MPIIGVPIIGVPLQPEKQKKLIQNTTVMVWLVAAGRSLLHGVQPSRVGGLFLVHQR